MAQEKKYSSSDGKGRAGKGSGRRLKVLIAGGPEALEQSSEILDSLLTIGYGVNLMGVMDSGAERLFPADPAKRDQSLYDELERLFRADPPDLLVITSDDYHLRKGLTEIAAPCTRILDSFALKLFQAIKRMTHLLDTTQQRLESAETSKELLMADSETSIMVVDEDLRVLEINKALLNRTKASREGTIGRPCHWAVKKSFEPCYEKGQTCLVREVLSTGRATHTVQEDVRSDGSSKWFTVSAYPLKGSTGGKRSVLVIWRDVTKGVSAVLTRQERDIREDFAHILHQDKMTALGKLAAAAVHEINNPIQGILTFAKLMRSSLDGPSLPSEDVERFRNYLDMIAAESARCGKILMNLLSFSRQGEVKKTAVDLKRVFDEVLLLLGNRLELAGVSVDLGYEGDIPSIFGDRDQMKQALLNLMLNALEAMPEGGSITIRCRPRPLSGSVEISVADTGTGVPAEIQARIFEPFFSTKQTGKGLGLGLSVVYGIVARHGGTIEFESEEGKGTTFVLTLPVKDRSDDDGEDETGSDSKDLHTV